MKDTFLHHVAADLYQQLGRNLSSCLIIFPNKRPEYYFKNALADIITEPITSPQVCSIEEFIQQQSGLKPVESLDLIFTLFKIYTRYEPQDDFESFHNWGNMLLRDYDELDRYLVDTSRFFANLSDIKEIEKIVQEDEENSLVFWRTLATQKPSQLQKRFIQHWEIIEYVYYELRSELQEHGQAYPGMLYRQAAENFLKRQYESKYEKIIFVGFNALSKAEEQIIKCLFKEEKALIYWDTDEYYLNNPAEEAGNFIRKSLKNLGIQNPKFVRSKLSKEAKEIHIIGMPLQVGQAKALGLELKKFIKHNKDYKAGETAVILPDENLLLPVMHSLPEELDQINITAGYPLSHTPLFTLFELINDLHENYNKEIKGFYYKDVLSILSHTYFSCRENEGIKNLIKHIEENGLIFIEQQDILQFDNCEILPVIFKPIYKVFQFIDYINKILDNIEKNAFPVLNNEESFIEKFREIILGLENFLKHQDLEVSIPTFLRFFRQAVQQTKIALQEDDPNAVQLMGTLESRSLDFKNLFILSVNEGILPGRQSSHSYIPYDLRKAFGLPTLEEQDSLYAYYFYRLLQGAAKIYLFYNGEGSSGEEKSRFIRQVEYFMARKNPNINISHHYYSLPLKSYKAVDIVIEKDEAFFSSLEKKTSQQGFSPSLISSYYICPLQFMMNYVIRLRPQEEITEDLEADRFGRLFHHVIEGIYKDFKGQEVTSVLIKQQRYKIENLLNEALKIEKLDKEYQKNRNSLLLETIKILINKVLDQDEQYAPFHILETEKKYHYTLPVNHHIHKEVKLQGTIDRVDEKDGIIRIVDYKTGRLTKLYFNFEQTEEILSKENKEAFQTLFYSWLYYKNFASTGLSPVIMHLKDVNKGYQVVNAKNGPLDETGFNIFEEKLKDIIAEILDPAQPIRQTDDRNHCQYCNYNAICLR